MGLLGADRATGGWVDTLPKVAAALLAAGLLLVGQFAYATQQCFAWTDGQGHTSPDGSSVCAAHNTNNSVPPNTSINEYSFSGGSPTYSGQTASCDRNFRCTLVFPGSNGQPDTTMDCSGFYPNALTLTAVPADCPANNCHAGDVAPDVLSVVGGSSSSAPGSACYNGCSYSVGQNLVITPKGAYTSLSASATQTGDACGPGTPSPNVPPATKSGDCVAFGKTTTCAINNPNGDQCGTVNGDLVCVSGANAPSAGSCSAYGDGALACDSAAKQPDNGTPGQPATPDAQASGGGSPQKTTDYYSPDTVAHSSAGTSAASGGQYKPGTAGSANNPSAAASAGGSGAGTAGDGKGNGGTECGNGKTSNGAGDCVGDGVSGGVDCSAPPVCTGDAVTCDIDLNEWRQRCPVISQSDVDTAVGTLPAVGNASVAVDGALSETGGPIGISTAACPAPISVTLNGRSVTIDLASKMCDFMGYIAGVIMLVAYFLGGLIMVRGVMQKEL